MIQMRNDLFLASCEKSEHALRRRPSHLDDWRLRLIGKGFLNQIPHRTESLELGLGDHQAQQQRKHAAKNH